MLTAFRNWIQVCRRENRHQWFIRPLNRIYIFLQPILQRLTLPLSYAHIRRHRDETSPEEWIDTVDRCPFGILRPLQIRSELLGLLRHLQTNPPQRLLEIGTANGGTLYTLCRCAAADAEIFSIDLPGGPFGGGYPNWKIGLLESFAGPDQSLHLWRGNSHETETRGRLAAALNGQQLDFLLIDGDHTYEGVKADFRDYGPFVRTGGHIAFHDISPHPRGRGGDVHTFWREIRDQFVTHEFVHDEQSGFGIGVLEWDGSSNPNGTQSP